MEIGWYLRFAKQDSMLFLLRTDQLDEAREICFIETDWKVADVTPLEPENPHSESGQRVRFVRK